MFLIFFFFKQKTAYELRISDWSSDVCSSDLVIVLNFIYANCSDICPLHSERIAEIQDMVNRTPMKGLVEFISVTTDPEHDTADVLVEYGSVHGLDPSNWHFLTRTTDQLEASTRKQIARPSCRERGCTYVRMSVVAESL